MTGRSTLKFELPLSDMCLDYVNLSEHETACIHSSLVFLYMLSHDVRIIPIEKRVLYLKHLKFGKFCMLFFFFSPVIVFSKTDKFLLCK